MTTKVLKHLPPNKELLIVGYSISNAVALMNIKKLWSEQKLIVGGKKVLGRSQKATKELTSKDMGGEIVLLDPDHLTGPLLGILKVRTPMGLYYSDKSKTLFTGSDHWVYGLSKGKLSRRLNNQYFNCIHCISKSIDGNLWVVCTGIDAVIKIDINNPNKTLSSWFATENGYSTSANGNVRYIDRNKRHQGIDDYSTPEHTTHINSVLEYKKNKLLATLFHQGELVEIDITTGKTITILKGLKQPHNIRKASFGYILSDTNGKRIIKIDNNLKFIGELTGDFDWIQDAIELVDGSMVIADANNGRILVTSPLGKIVSELVYGKDRKRAGVLMTIKAKDALNIFKKLNSRTI